jgi:hypothetical protein
MSRKFVLKSLFKKASGQNPTQEVHIFDFDSCLFRSPYPPADWKGGWWGSLVSLDEPCVPAEPDSSWWNSEVVSQAKASIQNPDVYTMLMTGRQDHIFRYRIVDLLNQAGLNFDFIRLSDSDNTRDFKFSNMKNKIFEFLRKDSLSIGKIKIWDDNKSYLNYYKKALEELFQKIPDPTKRPIVEVFHVVAKSKPALSSQPEGEQKIKKNGYLGLFLDSQSKADLIYHFPQEYENPYGEHVTLLFKPSEAVRSIVIDSGLIGKEYPIQIVGYAARDGVQAVAVEVKGLEDFLIERDRILHITISTSNDRKPVDSNKLLMEGFEKIQGPQIRGILLFR